MSGASWTDERVQTLKKLWNEGFSAAQIARELGGVTRNTVIGKLHRMNLRREEGGNTNAKVAADLPNKMTDAEAPSSLRNHWTREEEDALIELRNKGKPFPVVTALLNQRFPGRPKPFVVATATTKYYYLVKTGRAKPVGSEKLGPKQVDRAELRRVDFTEVHRTQDDFVRAEQVAALEARANTRPPHERVGLMELTQKVCHWPIGDPMESDFHFCGQPVGIRTNGKPSSYCRAHTELAYLPAKEWRPRRRS